MQLRSLELLAKAHCDKLDENLRLDNVLFGWQDALSISSEQDVLFIVYKLLDVFVKSDVNLKFKVRSEVALDKNRADMHLLMREGGRIVGVIEVKKPELSERYKRQTVAAFGDLELGQLYDYLMMVALTHGLRKVYGILTDYNFWRVCWIDLDAKPNSGDVASGDGGVPVEKVAVQRAAASAAGFAAPL